MEKFVKPVPVDRIANGSKIDIVYLISAPEGRSVSKNRTTDMEFPIESYDSGADGASIKDLRCGGGCGAYSSWGREVLHHILPHVVTLAGKPEQSRSGVARGLQ
jgi:hypothetical protein